MEYERSLSVARAPADLFALLCDERRLPEWREGLVAVRRTDDGPRDAAERRYAETVQTPLGTRTVAVAVTRDTGAHALRFAVLDGPIRPSGEMRIAAEGAGARLSYRIAYRPRLPLVTPIETAIFDALAANVDRSLDRLARLVESEEASR